MKKRTPILLQLALALTVCLSVHPQPLVNLGLVGVGRLPADSSDTLGPNVDTLGGIFSGLYLNSASVVQSGGTYGGIFWGLPDRGFGDGLTDYHPRLQTFSFSATPYYGPYPAPSQNQIAFANTATLLFRDPTGNLFTGYNPDDTNQTNYPKSPDSSLGAGKWSLDSEGIVRTADGGYYVSDEYGPFIYRFNAAGVLQDLVMPPPAFIPKSGPAYPRMNNFGLAIVQNPTNDSGRWVNRGLEGLTITPDGKKLVAMLQSPAIQDGENRNPSRNARILVFDIDPPSPTYHDPIAEYVYVLTPNANTARNRHTPVSEILALSNTRFLVLERDSFGRGGDPGAILYKKVVLADISSASNIINTGYDLEKGAPGQISLPRTGLPSNIVAVARTDLVDLADPKQLAKFGLNVNVAWDTNTISEKWEGLGIIPLNDPAAPNDYLLLVGNDNDFKAPVVYHNGQPVGSNDVVIDSMLLAFRIGADTTPPAIVCPTNATIAANSNCVAAVDLRSRVTGSDNSADPVTILQSPAPGTLLALGTHTVSFVARDAAGNLSQPCTITVTVVDQTPPAIASVIPNRKLLIHNGNRLVPVSLAVSATDNCDPQLHCRIISVTSNGPLHHKSHRDDDDDDDHDDDDGNYSQWDDRPDWQITGPLSVKLRTERSEDGPRRVYYITVACTDDAGNTSIATTTVVVSKHRKDRFTPGFMTRVTPYALPTVPDYTTVPLLSVGDRVPRTGQPGKEYQMVGIPDGLGAYRNQDCTISVLMNHEFGNTVLHEPRYGDVRDRGAVVSKLILAEDGSVLSADRAYNSIFKENVYFSTPPEEGNTNPAFARLCSASLAGEEAGFDRPIYFAGEESGGAATFDGRGGSLVAIFDNELHTVPKAGRIAWENAIVRPHPGRQTVLMCLEDGPAGPESQLFMYVGSKDRRSSSVLGRNGLDNGQLYVFVGSSPTKTNEVEFQSGALQGRWHLIPNAYALTDVELDAAAKAAGAFGFIRIEDGDFRPSDPNEFYFVTTGGSPGNMLGRLYRLNLNGKNVVAPAQLTVIYNADQVIAAGGDTAVSPDNIAVTDNYIMICEDGTAQSRPVMAAKGRQGNIWQFDLRKNYAARNVATLALAGQDGLRVGPGVWETTGIIDSWSLLGQGSWLFNVQAHPPTAAPGRNTVEDGQFLLMIRNR